MLWEHDLLGVTIDKDLSFNQNPQFSNNEFINEA